MKKFRHTSFLLVVSLLVGCGNISSSSSVHTHTYSDKMLYDDTHHWYEVTCGHDDAANKVLHNYTTTVIEPTCEEQGYTLYTCDCNYSYKDKYVDK